MSRYLSILMMICLVLATVSPACKFISGQASSLIEICAADGSIQKIAVTDDFLPVTPIEKNKKHDHANEDCSFCFAQSHFSSLISAPPLLDLPDQATTRYESAALSREELFRSHYQSRGPPVRFS